MRGHDSRAYGNLNVTVTVTPVNEHAPVVTGRETLSFRENTTGETRLYAYRATDGDRDTSFTWSVEGDDGDDFAIDEGVLTFRTPPDYEQPADRDTNNVYQVTVVASDGANRGTLGVTVTVTEQNEGPVVSGTPEFAVVENRNLPNAVYAARDPEAVGGVTTAITWSLSGGDGGDFTIDRDTGVLTFRTPPDHERPADANRDNVYEVTVRAHDGRNYGDFEVTVTVEDVAEITGPAALSQTENFEGVLATYSAAGEGVLDVDPSWRLSGADSGDFTIDRESGELTFQSRPDHERPADSNRDNVYSFAVQVSDGSYHGTLDVTVTVNAESEPPSVTGRDSLSFRENTPVTTRLYTYRATDPEGDPFTWHLGGLDASDFTITADSSGRGVLTFSSSPNFDSPGGSGDHGNQYLVTVQARDDQGNTGELPVTVTITDQNEGAVVSGQQYISVQENRDPALALASYSATDPEGQPIARWSLSGSDSGDFTIDGDGELTFRNTPDYDRPADANRDNEYRVTVRAHDGRTYGSLDVTVTVSNINEHAPVIRSGSRTSFTYREEGASVLYTYRATDQDRDDVISWTAGGTDGSLFEFNDRDGLVFREPPDHEAPQDSGRDNEYNLTVAATDSGGLSASLDVTVTVTAVDEGPEITGTSTYTVAEGGILAGADFTGRDPETPSAEVSSWRLAGSDSGDFTITGTGQNSARLTFRNPPDYDRPADSNRDNEHLVTIRAYNGSTYGSLDVTVTDRNEADPVVTGRDTLSFRENTSADTRLYTYRATDADRDTTIAWHVRGTDGDDFTIGTGGELFFSSIPDHEQAADSDSDNVYEITVVASDGSNEGTLAVAVTVTDVNEGPEITGAQSLAFDENTATDRVLATYTGRDPEAPSLEITRWSVTGRDGGDFSINEAGELTFRNPPDHERPADANRDNVYEVTVRASDGRVYGAHDVTVTVEAVDEAPGFRGGSRDSFSYRENGTASLYTYRATDPEGDEVAWSVSGADGGDFQIIESGVLTFRVPPDHDDPADDDQDNEYQVTVVATDQTGHAANLPVTVTVTDVNEGPVIADTGVNTAITVQENHDQVLATYAATDPEDPDLAITRWSVTGRDGGDFTINEDGELSFRNLPDHERPADSNRDNTYEVTIRASDGRYYGTLDAVVTVEAVDEAPEFQRNAPDSFAYQENGISAIHTYRATDPEGSDLTWSLSGTDSSAFSIGRTGVLTFNTSPDYEDPTDSGGDNVYLVTVETSDRQSHTARLDVTVTVTNLTDARAVIRGTAQVGRTLTAETSGIPDEDTQAKAAFSYQWSADDMDVEGATAPTYELSKKDEGKTIRVRVTFTDNAGKEKTLTSAATAPVKPAQSNEPATGLPTIDGTAQVGETLTADTSNISDADGLDNATFGYQWLAADAEIPGAANSTHTLADADEGKAIKVRVSFTDDADNEETLTSAATSAVAARTNTPATGAPTISGTVQVGETLTADVSGIADEDGLANTGFGYQWLADDEDIAGATGSTYTLLDADEDYTIKVRVSFTDDAGNEEMLTSTATDAVAAAVPTEPPAKPRTLRATEVSHDKVTLTWRDPQDDTITGYMILRRDKDIHEEGTFETVEANTGTADTTYTDTSVDPEKRYVYRIKAINAFDESELSSWVRAYTPAAPATENTPASGEPTISGTAQVGEALTADVSGIADEDGLDNAAFTYQWLADDVEKTGATNATYTLADAEEGQAIQVRVSFTDDAGNTETLTSTATAAVAAKPNSPATGAPSITGTAQVGETLEADTSGINDEDGLDSATFSYQWLADDAAIAGATGLTYTLAETDEGKAIKVRVSFTDDAGNEETLTSAATAAVAGAEPAERPSTPTGLSGDTSHDRVILSWDDPGDATIDGYIILRRQHDTHAQGQFSTLVEDTETAETTYTDDTVTPEKRYTYRIKAINEHGESERSRWFHTDTPAAPSAPATGAPTISGTVQVGATLTADVSGIVDADGLDNATFAYQWLAAAAEIPGATNSTHTLADADEGKAIKVRVSFTDDAGNEETLTSEATNAVAAASNSPATGVPIIDSKAWVGKTLTADVSGIADEDGLDNAAFSYQWLADDADISGATGSTHSVTDSERGKTIRIRVSFTDDAGNEEILTSEATRINTPATGTITIGGTAQVHEILRVDALSIVDTDGLSTARIVYHWLASDGSGNEFTLGAFVENPIYVVQAREEGMTIWVEIAFNDDAGNSERLRSPKIGVVTAAANPAVPQAPEHRRVTPALAVSPEGSGELEVSWSMPTYPYGDGGSVITGGKVQWKEATGSWDTEADVSESVILGNCTVCQHTITGLTNGVAYTVRVFVTNALGDSPPSDELTSTPTDGSTFTLSGISRTNYPEDEPHLVAYYTVSGSESAITWSLSGDDSDDFSIVAGRTVSRLEFDPKPNYQSPTDRDRDNQYQVTVHASDGTQEHTLEVTVVVEFRGLPTINGSAQVGETLTADTSGISDAHEMYFARFGYQWLADDVEIDGATSSTHTLIDSDVGKAIKVRVSFTDDAGNEETLTSSATDAVVGAGPTEAPARPRTLTAPDISHDSVTLRWEDPQDDTITGYMILRRDKDIHEEGTFETVEANTGTADTTYTDTSVDPEKRYVYRIKAINAFDESELSSWVRAYTPAAPATENTPASGEPTISGTAQVGETLTADVSGIADEDGLDNAAFSYQWLADDGEITGAANATHTLADADKGKAIRVRVSFTDDAGNDEALTSAATDPVAAKPNSPATGAPTINGTVQVGETLTADVSAIGDEDGLDNATFTYQWLADDTDTQGANGSSYTLVSDDEGKAVKVRVSFTDDAGNEETLTSAATDAVAARPASATSDEPTDRPHGLGAVAGAGGVTLTWTAPDDANAVVDYRILRHRPEEGEPEPLVYVDYTGGKATSYTDTDVEPGTMYVYRVQATDVLGFVGDASDPASVRVPGSNSPAIGEPAINGTVQVGETLTADASGITDADGLDNVAFAYQWLADHADIAGATDSTHTLVSDEEGKAIKVRVSFTDDAGNEETLTSAATAAVAAKPNSPATGEPTISGTTQVGETLTADGSAIGDEDGLDNATFTYQWLADDSAIAGATNSTYDLADADTGKAIRVRVSFSDDAGNKETLTSAATSAVAARPNSAATGQPTIGGTAQVGETLSADTSGIADEDGLETPRSATNGWRTMLP